MCDRIFFSILGLYHPEIEDKDKVACKGTALDIVCMWYVTPEGKAFLLENCRAFVELDTQTERAKAFYICTPSRLTVPISSPKYLSSQYLKNYL